jgi:hypothetical protein
VNIDDGRIENQIRENKKVIEQIQLSRESSKNRRNSKWITE